MLEESEISEHCFDLIFAFDEIVALGYRENVNLAQIRTFTEMDSHEEKVFRAVREVRLHGFVLAVIDWISLMIPVVTLGHCRKKKRYHIEQKKYGKGDYNITSSVYVNMNVVNGGEHNIPTFHENIE